MITAYHHTQITVPADTTPAAVRDFYGRLFGLAEIEVPPALQGRGLIWFAVGTGDRSLHVGLEDGVNRLATRAHLAYEVDDVAAFRQRLAGAGFEIIPQLKIEGYDRFHTHDPWGNRIEIIGRV